MWISLPRLNRVLVGLSLLGCAEQPTAKRPRPHSPPTEIMPPRDGGAPATDRDAEAADAASAESGVVPEPTCLWAPSPVQATPEHLIRDSAGCELAPVEEEGWRQVRQVRVLEVQLGERSTTIRLVLLDAQNRRVIPLGRRIDYEVILGRKRVGAVSIEEGVHRDGVFEIVLPADRRPKPCTLHVFARFSNGGAEPLEDWVDDWMYLC